MSQVAQVFAALILFWSISDAQLDALLDAQCTMCSAYEEALCHFLSCFMAAKQKSAYDGLPFGWVR